LHAKEIFLRDERRTCLVELTDANRKKTTTGKELAVCRQNVDGGDASMHCSLHAQTGLSPINPMMFDAVVLTAVATFSATLPELRWLRRSD
jgi:hypothetical protein